MPATRLTQRISIPGAVPFRPERTPEEVENDRRQSRLIASASLLASHGNLAAWLAKPCPDHDAKPGEHCIPFVGGICGRRIEASRA